MPGWSLFPHFIVRATGFPWELVERLRCPEAAAIARRMRELEGGLQRIRESAPRIHNPSRGVLAALKANRPVPLDNVEDPSLFTEWNRLAGALQDEQHRFEATLRRELDAADAQLRAIAADPRFLEAVASSSPPVFSDLERGRWSARVERQVASYVQRLTSKNETMSFFGPINYGRFDPGADTAVTMSWSGPAVLTGRRTHAASWMVRGVAAAIAFDPEVVGWLVPRRKGFADPPLPRKRRRLGEILIERGTVTAAQLARVLDRQPSRAQKIGELLVEAELCTPSDVEEALRLQRVGSPSSEGDSSADAVDALARLARAANGYKTLSAIAAELELPLDRLSRALQLACDKRILTHQLEPPSATHLPLLDLIERVAGVPGARPREHVAGLTEVLERLERYSAADAATKVRMNEELRQLVEARWNVKSPQGQPEEKGGHEKQRSSPEGPAAGASNASASNAGQPTTPERRTTQAHFYVDRLPLREECGGDLRMVIQGERARELIERLERPLDLLARAAERTREEARARVAQLVGNRRVPFWKVVAAFSDQPIPYDDGLSRWIASEMTDPTVSRFQADPSRLLAEAGPSPLPLICSVDLLFAAKDREAWSRGEYQVVMGDIHDTAQVWGWALQFHEARERVETEMVRAIGSLPRTIPVITALASRRTGLLPSEFPGPVIELGGVSVRPSGWHLPFDDLFVVSDGKSAHLRSQSLGSEVVLYNSELESLVHTAFALPRVRAARVDLGVHTPRVELGGVILQREMWRLSQEQVTALLAARDDRSRFRIASQLWEQLRLPQYVFAKLPDERKPVLVDPHSPHLWRAFLNLLEARGGAVFSEMLPGPSELWLKGPLGHHTSELRCTFLRGA